MPYLDGLGRIVLDHTFYEGTLPSGAGDGVMQEIPPSPFLDRRGINPDADNAIIKEGVLPGGVMNLDPNTGWAAGIHRASMRAPTLIPVEHDPFAVTNALGTVAPQSVTAFDPSWRDRLAQWMMGDKPASPAKQNFVSGLLGSKGLGPTGMSLSDVTPLGAVLSAQESAHKGNYSEAGLAIMPGSRLAGPLQREAGAAIRAFHGSPHDFDRFDLSKIGAGEGHQTYGHGIYLAENPTVAGHYRDKFGEKARPYYDPQSVAHKALTETGGDYAAAIKHVESFRDMGGALGWRNGGAAWPEGKQAWQLLTDRAEIRPAAHMYEVDVRAPERMLDWDAPLNKQTPEATEILRKLDQRHFDDLQELASHYNTNAPEHALDSDYTVGELHRYLSRLAGEGPTFNVEPGLHRYLTDAPQSEVAMHLRGLGASGFKYLDEGSRNIRGAGVLAPQIAAYEHRLATDAGLSEFERHSLRNNVDALKQESERAANATRNMVVFDDNLIDIVKKYGIAGAAALTGMKFIPVDHDPFQESQ